MMQYGGQVTKHTRLIVFIMVLQFIVHVSGWRSKDITLTIPIIIGSVPYQPPVLPSRVEPSAPPLCPPPYSDDIEPYPGVGKLSW